MPATILLYHHVTQDDAGPNHVPVERFRSHLDILARAGRRVVGMDEAVSMLPGRGKTRERAVCLTFDDGGLDLYELAMPVLQEYGFPATVFLPSGLAGVSTRSDFDGRPNAFISWEQAREMAAAGMDVQSHARSHRDLTTLGPEELEEELAGSRRELEQGLGAAVNYVAYPYGRFNAMVLDAAGKAGYTAGFAAGYSEAGRFALERMSISGLAGPCSFRFRCSGLAQRLRRLKNRMLRRTRERGWE